jgi:hypothetical protein
MDTGKPGKTRTPRLGGRPGSGLLIRPHVGAETRVKSGGRAERGVDATETVGSDVPDVASNGKDSENRPRSE